MATEHTITNNLLTVRIKQPGAELCSIYNNETRLEYMWSADPAFWGKSSPVLFPIVGALKNNQYFYNDNAYTLSRHGFARDRVFTVEEQQRDRIVFMLKEDNASMKVYPFPFELRITYLLNKQTLQVLYSVTNTGNTVLLFSLGAHPAFKIPLVPNTSYSDYYLEFSHTELAPRWPLNETGLIVEASVPFLQHSKKLMLKKELFYNDALVFKNLKSNSITLGSSAHLHRLQFQFEDFPFFGIWAAKEADFICLEPWCGIADSIGHTQQLSSKEGIENLSAAKEWQRRWSVTCE